MPTPFGEVSLPAKPSMLCSFGLKFTDWVRDVAAPLTLAYTGQKLAEIETGPGFTCTARYDKPGALPSEHAKGDAIGVVSFVLADKRRVTVKEPDPLVGALRMTACGYFTTVLGPGADPSMKRTCISSCCCRAVRQTIASANNRAARRET